MKIYHGICDLIGNTPLVALDNLAGQKGVKARILGKLESCSPGGSVKDRIAKAMVEDAEKSGLLKKGSVIIEPTSGNTGIGLACVAAAKGYRAIITMPDNMTVERRNLLSAYGVELVLTEGSQGMKGAIKRAEELAEEIPHAFIPSQFENPANPAIHRATTGPEIWEDTEGKVDIFIAGVGSGGTLTGVGQYLKEQDANIKVIAVEPADANILSGGSPGPHKIQGIGAGFVPGVLDTNIYDEVIAVENSHAYDLCRDMARYEGLLVGASSGAVMWAAVQLGKRPENQGKIIVGILADTGERYLSLPSYCK